MEQLSLWVLSKTCTRCGETKPIDAFRLRKNRHGNPRRTSFCIECLNRESSRRYYEQRERWLAKERERRLQNGDTINARRRADRVRNPEKYRARERRRARARNASRAAYKKEWTRANRERVNAAHRRQYAAKPREKHREKWRRDRLKNPEASRERVRRRRALKRARTVGVVTVALLRVKWDFWSGRCWMCGGAATQWDHVKPIAKGGPHMLANLRPACGRCNRRKRDLWPLPADF